MVIVGPMLLKCGFALIQCPQPGISNMVKTAGFAKCSRWVPPGPSQVEGFHVGLHDGRPRGRLPEVGMRIIMTKISRNTRPAIRTQYGLWDMSISIKAKESLQEFI
jgi:hypothetical protein